MAQDNRQSVWRRFKRNKVAWISSIFLLSLFVLSLFAYLIVPDNTPNANYQSTKIALKEPGFRTKVLRIKKNIQIVNPSFFGTILRGKVKDYEEVPFTDIQFLEKQIQLTNHYNRPEFYSYQDVLFDLDLLHEPVYQDHFVDFKSLDGRTQHVSLSELREKAKGQIHERTFWLGTDKFGRDILSRIVLGIRISVFIGFIAVFISLVVGITLGSIAGYYGGWLDQVIMLILNINWSIPTILMVFAIVLAFDRGISVIFLAIGLTMWVEVARIVRGQVKSLKNEQYVMAAINLGFSSTKILFQHILPNIIGPILVIAASNFSTAVLVEAGLSYLGFGIEPPTPSIGNILNEHYGYAITGKVFLAIVPAITIMLLVLSFNLVGSGLRDAFDVKRNEL